MVPSRQPSASSAQANWQEHVDGKSRYSPPILPLAPAKFTGSLFLTGRSILPECTSFNSSVQKSDFHLRPNCRSERRRDDLRYARLHVLGGRMRRHAGGLHDTAEQL